MTLATGRNAEGNWIACLSTEVVFLWPVSSHDTFFLCTGIISFRYNDLNRAWELLFKLRWPENGKKILQISHIRVQDRIESGENEHSTDWRQRYWESHLQEYACHCHELILVQLIKHLTDNYQSLFWIQMPGWSIRESITSSFWRVYQRDKSFKLII